MLRGLTGSSVKIIQIRRNHFNAEHLGKCAANYSELTPLSPFKRTVKMFPSKPAYVFEDKTRTWGEIGVRVSKFASALTNLGLAKGDVVSIFAPNSPPVLEAHFAVPGIGAVLHTFNTRLDAATIAYQLKHGEPKVLIVDNEFTPLIRTAIDLLKEESHQKLPTLVSIGDEKFPDSISPLDYEDFLQSGNASFELLPCTDEWDAIALNYTSGTTGNPKGVVYHHRGAYLNSVNNIIEWNMANFSKLLMSTFKHPASIAKTHTFHDLTFPLV